MFNFLQLLQFLYIINVIIYMEAFNMAILNLGATGHAFKDETFEKVANNLKSNNIDRIQLTPAKISNRV